jgi:uncharacterized membrane protein YraQ (UPF0718 family)
MLLKLTDLLVYDWIGLDGDTRLGAAVHFFFYDCFKIFLLLAVMIFVIGLIRTWLPDHKLKKWMSAGGLWGNVVAAVFGAITPFLLLLLDPDFYQPAQGRSPPRGYLFLSDYLPHY